MKYKYEATYVKNYDGDTIDFLLTKEIDFGFKIKTIITHEIRVRLYGIDTYEIREEDPCLKKLAYKAKEFVRDTLLKSDRIVVETIKDRKGKYGRYLARVKYYYKGEKYDLCEELLSDELAVPYL